MSILQIAILAIAALVLGRLPKARQLTLLAVSALTVFLLQPSEPFASLLFWLPVATLTVALLGWVLPSSPEVRSWKQNSPAFLVVLGVILLADLNRYFKLTQLYISSTPS